MIINPRSTIQTFEKNKKNMAECDHETPEYPLLTFAQYSALKASLCARFCTGTVELVDLEMLGWTKNGDSQQRCWYNFTSKLWVEGWFTGVAIIGTVENNRSWENRPIQLSWQKLGASNFQTSWICVILRDLKKKTRPTKWWSRMVYEYLRASGAERKVRLVARGGAVFFCFPSLLELLICHQRRGGRNSFSTIIPTPFRPPFFSSASSCASSSSSSVSSSSSSTWSSSCSSCSCRSSCSSCSSSSSLSPLLLLVLPLLLLLLLLVFLFCYRFVHPPFLLLFPISSLLELLIATNIEVDETHSLP